jgi:DNA-binding MarR family transcriptional regulator
VFEQVAHQHEVCVASGEDAGNEVVDPRVEAEPALVDESHRGRGGDDLGHGEPEQRRVGSHGAAARDVGESGGTDVLDGSVGDDRGGASVNEIAHFQSVTKQAASQQVASLVKRGYAANEPAEHDARSRTVTLTDKGRAARRAAIDVADAIESELTERAGARALQGWRKVTDAMIDAYLDDAPEVVRVAAQMRSSD